MRPVDADAIYKEALENHQKGEIEDWEFDLIINYLDGAPTLNVETNMRCKDCKLAATASIRQIQEVTTMFQIELLSGGVFWVYAVDAGTSDFLIYKDDAWHWTPIDWYKPYYLPAESYLNKQFIFPMETGGAE